MSKKVKRIRIGDKEYSLNDIWRLCRKMWADIKDEPNIIIEAKKEWLEKHGFVANDVASGCFFCTWAVTHCNTGSSGSFCDHCPGRMVDSQFNCTHEIYHYYYKPRKFEVKIKALDLKRVH